MIALAVIAYAVAILALILWLAQRKHERKARIGRLGVLLNGERHYERSMWG